MTGVTRDDGLHVKKAINAINDTDFYIDKEHYNEVIFGKLESKSVKSGIKRNQSRPVYTEYISLRTSKPFYRK